MAATKTLQLEKQNYCLTSELITRYRIAAHKSAQEYANILYHEG